MSRELEELKPGASPIEDTTVVDVDVHLSARGQREKMANHMDEPYRSYVHPDTGGNPYPSIGYPRQLGGKLSHPILDADSPEVIEKNLREDLGIDYPILNTNAGTDHVFGTERGIQEMRAANNILVEDFLDQNDDYMGVISVAARAPDKAAEEIDRWGDNDQVVGVYFRMCDQYQDKPLGDSRYDVIYKAMSDNDLSAGVFHIGIMMMGHFPVARHFETVFGTHMMGFAASSMVTVTSLIENGVPEKFPDLNFVMLEAGLAYVPFMMGRLNNHYGHYSSELPLLEKMPEEYLKDQFYWGNQPLDEFQDPMDLQKILDIIGVDSLVFGTDFPHHDFDHPSAYEKYLKHFSAEDRKKVLHGNAIEAFDIADRVDLS